MRKVYAIYRGLYGTDFNRYSYESVLPYVDKVIVVYAGKPWGNVEGCTYKGKHYKFPAKFDEFLECIPKDPKIHVIEAYHESPVGQFSAILNDIVYPKFGIPDLAFLTHVGMVWKPNDLTACIDEMFDRNILFGNSNQVELWRGLNWRQPERRQRFAVGFVRTEWLKRMPQTYMDAWPMTAQPILLKGCVHNCRYAQNPNIMFWRQLVVMAHAEKSGDSLPNPDWFEEKWLNWTPSTQNIEMAQQWAWQVPFAIPYDTAKLPESLQQNLPEIQARTSNAAWRGVPCQS